MTRDTQCREGLSHQKLQTFVRIKYIILNLLRRIEYHVFSTYPLHGDGSLNFAQEIDDFVINSETWSTS
jgi:hypothetical protein